MQEDRAVSWTAEGHESANDSLSAERERNLALVDRVLGLEAEVAQLSIASSLAPSDVLAAERRLGLLQRSSTWRIGRLVTAPGRVVMRSARSMAKRVLTDRP